MTAVISEPGALGRRGAVPAVPAGFEIRVEPDRDVAHLKPLGELDIATVDALRMQVDELLEVGFDHLVLDLRGLEFLDVAGLRLVLELAAHARRDGWQLDVIQGPECVRRLFALTHTLQGLPFTSTMR